jgi:hypothetical protein
MALGDWEHGTPDLVQRRGLADTTDFPILFRRRFHHSGRSRWGSRFCLMFNFGVCRSAFTIVHFEWTVGRTPADTPCCMEYCAVYKEVGRRRKTLFSYSLPRPSLESLALSLSLSFTHTHTHTGRYVLNKHVCTTGPWSSSAMCSLEGNAITSVTKTTTYLLCQGRLHGSPLQHQTKPPRLYYTPSFTAMAGCSCSLHND